ncbi:hypothetical protein BpHYR1_019209 [Brachionus plicatilis]|uniref:Uncharacterized protein n=1 Tax=Brachionus plicatilis TaxID=10195 RepID=A0A3M7RE51_BRAPC|nr:hypothetical protein BpHYR1_019209 [Brachionus plicatilis]
MTTRTIKSKKTVWLTVKSTFSYDWRRDTPLRNDQPNNYFFLRFDSVRDFHLFSGCYLKPLQQF